MNQIKADSSGLRLFGWLMLASLGVGSLSSAFVTSRWLVHKTSIPGETFRNFIAGWIGSSTVWPWIATFVIGWIAFVLLWMTISLLCWGIFGTPTLSRYGFYFGKCARWLGLLVIPAIALVVASPIWQPILWLIALVVVVASGLIALLQFPGFLADNMQFGNRAGWISRLSAVGTAVVLGLLVPTCLRCFAPESGDAFGRLHNSLVLLSFDAEEDWQGKESSVQGDIYPGDSFYLGTFLYVTSGYLDRLVEGLARRGISATFYCTPNLAKAHPEALQKISKSGHEIAVHLHPHQGRQVDYPFVSKNDKDLCEYPEDAVAQMIAEAKHSVEHAAQVSSTSFRSGEWSCDAGIESILTQLGFQSFSNHTETFRLPGGMWQVATENQYDMIASPEKMLLQIMAKKDGGGIIPCFSHPMVGYDYIRKTPDEAGLEHYFAMLDLAKSRCPSVKFVTTSEAVALLRETSPSTAVKGVVLGGFVIGNLLLAFVCGRCGRCLGLRNEL